ncbi:hypothetical protein SYNPS1DRAFT_2288, partial [Syncephalis pseudoplumigaleata]
KCNTIRKRYEIRTLPPQQRQSFFNAVKGLQAGPQPNKFDDFAELHNEAGNYAHFSPVFLPWHRAFLYHFERALQEIDASVMLPYWDWSYDSQAPEASVVLSDAYFGGNGRASDQCLANGQLAAYRPYHLDRGCVKRQFDKDGAINPFYSTEAVQRLITQNDDFGEFRGKLEGIFHARVHIGIGGHMNTMHSAADAIFYMHHGMVDKIWATWQRHHPKEARAYFG